MWQVVYTRERERILRLSEVLISKKCLLEENISQAFLRDLEGQCWELLKSEEYFNHNNAILLSDFSDLEKFDFVTGDTLRQKSLEKLAMRYCIEVLFILFECIYQQKRYSECMSFMNVVRERQPLVLAYLTAADLEGIL